VNLSANLDNLLSGNGKRYLIEGTWLSDWIRLDARGLVFDFDMLPEDTKPYFRDVYFSRDFFDHCTNSSRAGKRKASCSVCSRRVTLKLRFPHCELVLRASAEQQWPSK
jgi:hypothetical protein